MATVSLPYTLQAGQPENVNQLVANLNSLVAGVNTVDTAQIANGAVTPAKSATAVVSTIPTTGLVDGMEISYQSAGMASSGLVWRLKYRAGSSSSYKWEFVGGSPLIDSDNAQRTATLTDVTWAAVDGSNDPTVTVPLAGDYLITHAATIDMGLGGGSIMGIGVKVGSTEPSGVTGDGIVTLTSMTADARSQASTEYIRTAIAASTAITQRYYQSSGGSRNFDRWSAHLAVVPVRVI